MHAGADFAPLELLHDLSAIDAQLVQVQPQHVQMPGVLAVGPVEGELQGRHAVERGVIALSDLHPPLPHALGLGQLGQAHAGGDVGHVVLVAGRDDLVVPGALGGVAFPGVLADAVQRHDAAALGQGIVVGDDHAAFAGGDGLGGVEGEADDMRNAECGMQEWGSR